MAVFFEEIEKGRPYLVDAVHFVIFPVSNRPARIAPVRAVLCPCPGYFLRTLRSAKVLQLCWSLGRRLMAECLGAKS